MAPEKLNVYSVRMVFVALVTVCWLGSFQDVAAQDEDVSFEDYDPGLKGGVVFSSFRNAEMNSDPLPGFSLGLFVNYDFTDRWAAQTELNYMEKGARLHQDDVNYDLHLTYLEIPVTAKHRFNPSGKFSPIVLAGPYAAFLLNSYSSTEFQDSQPNTPDQWLEYERPTEWGLLTGIGTEIDIELYVLKLELQYAAGLSSVFDDSVPGAIKNDAFRIVAGLSF